MTVKSLSLNNFRNYTQQAFHFAEGINIFYGNNGQGKTNILEALFLCSIGRSFRTNREEEMIRSGEEGFEVSVSAEDAITESIRIQYNRRKQKAVQVNGLYIRKLGHLMGALPSVLFSPQNMLLLSAGPGERRKFIDIALCQLKPAYYFDLQQYNKIIMQKNVLLRENERKSKIDDILDVWNLSLSEYGAKIIKERIAFLKQIALYATERHYEIAGGAEKISLHYVSSIAGMEESSEQEIQSAFYKVLEDNKSRETERRASLFGPHRDDLDVKLNEAYDIKKYGSQGQKRTCVLALKLAEMEILKTATGNTPILLLDDVMSELDTERQNLLLDNIKEAQTFITCTDINKLKNVSNSRRSFFCIQNGSIAK